MKHVRYCLLAACFLLIPDAFHIGFARGDDKGSENERGACIAEIVFRWKDRVCQKGAVNRDLRFTFAVDDDELGFSENRAPLDSVYVFMNAMPSVRLEVGQHLGGYTRLRKSQEFQLSQLRAQAIVAALTEMGVDRSRLTAVGYGTSVPLITRDSMAAMSRYEKEHAHQVNRRTEFKILSCE